MDSLLIWPFSPLSSCFENQPPSNYSDAEKTSIEGGAEARDHEGVGIIVEVEAKKVDREVSRTRGGWHDAVCTEECSIDCYVY